MDPVWWSSRDLSPRPLALRSGALTIIYRDSIVVILPIHLLGIDPTVDMHKKYIDELCQDFESKMKNMITESIAEHKAAETENLLYVEVMQHTLFCKKKVEVVYGRKSTLKVPSEACYYFSPFCAA